MMLAPSKRSLRRSSAIGNRLTAHYEYSPFGQQTRAIGTYASSNPFRFSSEYYDAETGLVYYNYRYYDAKLGRWLSKDPIGEAGGSNLYFICNNNPVFYFDKNGYEMGIGKTILLAPSLLLGGAVSILSGDIFRRYPKASFSNVGCEFLITVNGMFNGKRRRDQIHEQIKSLPRFHSIAQNGNAVHFHNHTAGPLDIIQSAADEIGIISLPSAALARDIAEAVKQAKRNKCKCFKIYVVAHSQGTSTFRNALPLIDDEYKENIHFIGIGGERLANPTWGIGDCENHININDPVPISNFATHPIEALDSVFDEKTRYNSEDFLTIPHVVERYTKNINQGIPK